MKKLLLITLIIPFISLAQEDTQTDSKQNVCWAYSFDIYKEGLAPCKEGDIFVSAGQIDDQWDIRSLLRICKTGSINFSTGHCTLEAKEKWKEYIDHSEFHKNKKKKK